MKKSTLLAFVTFVIAVGALALAAALYIARKRELFGCEGEDFDDDMLDADLEFSGEPNLSAEAEGNTAPIDNADPPADALPLEH